MNQINKLQQTAIQAAINLNWTEAINVNQQILELDSKHIATLNRLAFALMQSGNVNQANKTYKQVLELDKYNPIAQKGLEKLSSLKDGSLLHSNTTPNGKLAVSFLEEPGKTKAVVLVKPTASRRLIALNPGTVVKLVRKNKTVSVESLTGDYVGCLPDDVGFRLSKLIKDGYQYETVIKNNQNTSISVFIKEIFKPSFGDAISFPGTNRNSSGLETQSSGPIEEVPIDVTPTGEEDADDN